MNDRPDAPDLIAIARDTYTAEVLPALPEALRYTGLMIANALAIAQREIEAGDAPARAEYERLCELLSEAAAAPAGAALHAAVAGYNRRLANDIRAGRFDGQERAAMLAHLHQATAEKLAVSNPKALHPSPPTLSVCSLLPPGEGIGMREGNEHHGVIRGPDPDVLPAALGPDLRRPRGRDRR